MACDDFDKYIKFFTQKCIQVIVQSRDGSKLHTKSNTRNTEWFNILLPDKRDIVEELRQTINPPYPQNGRPVNVEITMETPDGGTCVMEVWQFKLNTKRASSTPLSGFYSSLSLLLKSLLSVTRILPSYYFAQKNEELKFRIFAGSAPMPFMNTNMKDEVLGEVSCQHGTICVSVTYSRTYTPQERVSQDVSTSLPVPASLPPSNSPQSLQPLHQPFGSHPLSKHFTTEHEPFSTLMNTQPITNPSSNSSTTTPLDNNSLRSVRQDSEDLVTMHSNNDGYLILDIQEKSAFLPNTSSECQDINELLSMSTDPPHLDLFNDGIDLLKACDYLDNHIGPLSSSPP